MHNQSQQFTPKANDSQPKPETTNVAAAVVNSRFSHGVDGLSAPRKEGSSSRCYARHTISPLGIASQPSGAVAQSSHAAEISSSSATDAMPDSIS
jgi:hypothetical protein